MVVFVFCNCLLLLLCYYFCLRDCGRFVFDLLFELVDASIVKLDYCMSGWFAVCLVGLIWLCGFAIDWILVMSVGYLDAWF